MEILALFYILSLLTSVLLMEREIEKEKQKHKK